MKTVYITLLKYTFGITVLFLLFYQVGFKEVYEVTRQSNLSILITTPFIYMLGICLNSVNLRLLFRPLIKSNNIEFFKFFWLSSSIGLLIPGKIGNLSIIYFLRNKGVRLGEATSILILDKLITVVVSIAFACLGLLAFLDVIDSIQFIMIIVISLAVLIFLLFSKISRNIIKRYLLRKYSVMFKGFSRTFFDYLRYNKTLIVINTIVTFIKYIMMGFLIYLIFLALYTHVTMGPILFITGIEFAVALIPITIGGLGIRESVGTLLYHNLGIPYPIIVSRYAIGLFLRYSIGALSFFLYGKDLEKMGNILYFWNDIKRIRQQHKEVNK